MPEFKALPFCSHYSQGFGKERSSITGPKLQEKPHPIDRHRNDGSFLARQPTTQGFVETGLNPHGMAPAKDVPSNHGHSIQPFRAPIANAQTTCSNTEGHTGRSGSVAKPVSPKWLESPYKSMFESQWLEIDLHPAKQDKKEHTTWSVRATLMPSFSASSCWKGPVSRPLVWDTPKPCRQGSCHRGSEKQPCRKSKVFGV